jgi:hypothetical protein
MKIRRKRLLVAAGLAPLMLIATMLYGCKSAPLYIQGGGFRNMTDEAIRDVQLLVVGTGRQASCSYIAPQGFFGTQIPLKEYEANQVVMTWTYQGRNFKSGPFTIPVPDPIPDEPVIFVVRIHPSGHTTADFIPVSQIPARYTR